MKIYPPIAIIIGIGIGLVAFGLRYPQFTAPDIVERLTTTGYDQLEKGVSSDKVSKWWHEEKAKYRTPHRALVDSGTGIVVLGICLLIFFYLKKVKVIHDIGQLKTPKTRIRFFLYANVAWISQIPAEYLYLEYTQARYDYPPWADSIGLPLMQTVYGCLVLLPVINLLLGIVLWKAHIPVNIWAWSKDRKISSWVWSSILGVVGVVLMAAVFEEIIFDSGVFYVPMLLGWIYLIICTRAILIERTA